MRWILAREELELRKIISWYVIPEMFSYCDPEEADKEEISHAMMN
jgi:hypothetical protein